ncbi:MAG: exopolysaccharide biosynthesis polyprenyl glycosylphosphotransferase [Candidatus Eiseniibacteriota bacterium]|nr:MAG: exopolysaccharide biosynthesis polyprenyl glycosylphosphotransferase [Candidatus Eisenbacteria bacterium]
MKASLTRSPFQPLLKAARPSPKSAKKDLLVRFREASVAGVVREEDAVPPVWTVTDDTVYLRYFKRGFDVALSLVGLLLGSPLACLIALAIKLDSPGPVLFKQVRVGQGGKPFVFYKFRSMFLGAEGIKREFLHLNQMDGPVFKLLDDPRITRVGRFLRRSSLDELPQLFNVLKGEMSLVGPRPPVPEEVRLYEPWQMRRLAVKPGLTCLWQVSGRSMIGFEEWMRLDIQYIRNRSLLLDLQILLRTVPAVLSGTGAY